MRRLRASWSLPVLLIILSVSSFCCNLSEARHHHEKHPSAVVVGAVYCDTCFQNDMAKGSHYISGATVAVECAEGNSRPAFHEEVTTDKQGSFRVHLPYSISKHTKEIEGCTVKLVKSSEPYCAVASTASSSLIHLKEKKGGKHIFSAGFFTFKPLKQPGLCNQQPSVTKSQLNSLGDMLPNPQIPSLTNPQLPPLPNPQIPSLTNPQLPPLPTPQIPSLTNPQLPPLPTPQIPTLPLPNPSTPIGGMPSLPGLPSLSPLPQLPLIPPLPELPPMPILPPPSKLSVMPVRSTEDSKVENGEVSHPQFFFPPLVTPPSTGLPPIPIVNPPGLLPNPLQPPAPPLIPNIPVLQPPTPPPGLIPGVPGVPGLPSIPTIPTVPTVPGIPGVPGLPPGLPTIPTLPPFTGFPGLPGLVPPPSPPPPASLLPPIFPPGFPGIPFPPAKTKKVSP